MFRVLFLMCCLTLVAACTEEDPLYCSPNKPCGHGYYCDYPTNTCLPMEAGVAPDSKAPAELGPDHRLDAAPDVPQRDALADVARDAAPADTTTIDAPGKPNGASCTGGLECTSGFCADGVCCDGECKGTCRSCTLAGKKGTCTLSPKGKDPDKDCAGSVPACGGTCDGKGACTFAPPTTACGAPTCAAGQLTTKSCDGKGGCASKTSSCGGYACDAAGSACRTACSSDAHCSGAFQCIGKKCVANLPTGTACGTNNKACASGHCVDGYCCNTACNAACQTCKLAGKLGTCSPEPNGTTCGQSVCTGFTLTALECQSGSCTPKPAACPGYYKCDSAGKKCLTSCSNNGDCDQAKAFCSGTTCAAKKQNGGTCSKGFECASGNCVDGRCCNSACTGTCKSCAVAGKLGTCSNVPSGQDPASECLGADAACDGACNGAGACTFPGASKTCAATTCTSGSLSSYKCDGAGTCVSSSSSCGSYACNAAGTACMTSCTTDANCASGKFCHAGTCVSWVTVPSGTTASLWSLWVNNASDIWAVGDAGTILHYNGSDWSLSTSNTTYTLKRVWGASGSDIWAVGEGGRMVHYNGSSWSESQQGSNTHHGLWGCASNDIWAVGQTGYHYNGTWTQDTSIYGNTLWGSSCTDVWLNSGGSVFKHYTGSWADVAKSTSEHIHNLWGFTSNDVWAVGDKGTVLRYNGTWAAQSPKPNTTQFHSDIWGTSSSDVWIIGHSSTIYHFDGATWKAIPSGTGNNIFSIRGSSTSDVWIVGYNGTILHLE